MQLASDHIFYTAGPDIAEIAKPLKQLGITYFSYMKSDLKGGRIYLYNNTEILDSYLKCKYYLCGNKESTPLNYKKQICLWSALPNQHEYDVNVRARGIDHGMFMFEPNGDSLEVFAFATQKENEGIINTYLTKMDLLINFKKFFREKADPIIKQAEKQKLVLPFNTNPDIKSYLDDSAIHDNLFLSNTDQDNILTQRQIECCQLLLKGNTSKQIAELLGLSSRTVEYYFGNIRTKLQCNNKAELITKLIQLLNQNRE